MKSIPDRAPLRSIIFFISLIIIIIVITWNLAIRKTLICVERANTIFTNRLIVPKSVWDIPSFSPGFPIYLAILGIVGLLILSEKRKRILP